MTVQDYVDLGNLAQHIPNIELRCMTDAEQDQIGCVYTRLTGLLYDKHCSSCQSKATQFMREALQDFHANVARQKMIPPTDA